MFHFHSFGAMFSNIFGSNRKHCVSGYSLPQNATSPATTTSFEIPEIISLKFHPVHGKAVKLLENNSVARRDSRYFEHSVVFSHRPISVNETISIQILETNLEFHGPLRIGFTSIDPSHFLNAVNIPLGRDLKRQPGVWLQSVHMQPMAVGTVIHYKIDIDGTVLYGVNGKNEGVFLRNVNPSQTLWAVLEAYGVVQTFKFATQTMDLTESNGEQDQTDQSENIYQNMADESYSLRRVTRSVTRRLGVLSHVINSNESSLSSRRDVRLSPLRILSSSKFQSPLTSPKTPFSTPGPFHDPTTAKGLCIICTDMERNTAFTECGHICMCYECADSFHAKRSRPQGSRPSRAPLCPICRGPISSILRIYY